MRTSLKLSLTFAACVALAGALVACGRSITGTRSSDTGGAAVSARSDRDERARAEDDLNGVNVNSDDLNGAALKLPLRRPRIVVSKAARRLVLYEDERVVRTYRVGLGTAPVGDKEREGDRRTPEGDFYVCVKNERSAFYLSLGLSYPEAEDAERGLRDRLITRAQYRRILRALRRKETPPWNTALGGMIFIHGNGSRTDWTWGCVALEDTEIKELFDAVPVGTPVRIEP